MKNTLAALLLLAVSTVTVAVPASQPLSWYNGTVKMDIYPQPGLCVLPAKDQSDSPRAQNAGALGERDGWRIYRDQGMSARSAQTPCKSFWTSAQKLADSTHIYAEPDGILVQFKKSIPEEKIEQWLASKGMRGEPQSLPNTYWIRPLQNQSVGKGEAMIRLSTELMEEKPSRVDFAVPNWESQSRLR